MTEIKAKAQRAPFSSYVTAGLLAHEPLHHAFLLYHHLLADLVGTGVYRTNKELAERLDLAESTIKRAAAWLNEIGLITVVKEASNRRLFQVATEGTPELRGVLAKLAKRVYTPDTVKKHIVNADGLRVSPDLQSGTEGLPRPAVGSPETFSNHLKLEEVSTRDTGVYVERTPAEVVENGANERDSGIYTSTSTSVVKSTDTSTSTSKGPAKRKLDWRDHAAYPAFLKLFALWRELSPYAVNWKEDETRFKYVRGRLADGFTVDELETVLREAAKNPIFDFGSHRTPVDFKHIFTKRDKVERALASALGPASRSGGNARTRTDSYNPALGASNRKNTGEEF